MVSSLRRRCALSAAALLATAAVVYLSSRPHSVECSRTTNVWFADFVATFISFPFTISPVPVVLYYMILTFCPVSTTAPIPCGYRVRHRLDAPQAQVFRGPFLLGEVR